MITYFCPECKVSSPRSECELCGTRTAMSSKLYWCCLCNVPTYTEQCPVCGGRGEYFATDARPVFPEERMLLEAFLVEPMKYSEKAVWNSNGIYYVDGKKINFSIDKINRNDVPEIRKFIDDNSSENSYDYFNDHIQKFIKANKDRYNDISTEAMDYIIKASRDYDIASMFVSFSGGKDSTVTSRKGYSRVVGFLIMQIVSVSLKWE